MVKTIIYEKYIVVIQEFSKIKKKIKTREKARAKNSKAIRSN